MSDRPWKCVYCGKETAPSHNYCDGACVIAHASAEGGFVHTPNGLPVRCVRFDGLMTEMEGGDHPDYRFPVEIESYDVPYGAPETGIQLQYPQTEALIYTDGSIALTLYECNYSMWSLYDGDPLGGTLQSKSAFLSEASRQEILARLKDPPHDLGARLQNLEDRALAAERENEKRSNLARKIASIDPIECDGHGEWPYCFFCGANSKTATDKTDVTHKEDCIWIEAGGDHASLDDRTDVSEEKS
jgi:hypothetical protein